MSNNALKGAGSVPVLCAEDAAASIRCTSSPVHTQVPYLSCDFCFWIFLVMPCDTTQCIWVLNKYAPANHCFSAAGAAAWITVLLLSVVCTREVAVAARVAASKVNIARKVLLNE